MKIKRIKAFGIKGGDFNHELAGVTLICGRNFTGKTARLEAVRLALMGYLPELGKANGATMGLARNGSLTVEAELEDGRHVERTWKQGKTGVKATVDGNIPETPAVLMDPSTYFSLGEKDRVRYVFGLINVEEKVNADTVIAELKNIRLEENTSESERMIRELVEWVDESDRTRHDAGTPIQDWLEEIVAGTREKLRFARQNLDRAAKTVQGLTAMQSAEAPTVDVREELDKVRNYLAELTARKNTVQARQKERQQTERMLKDARLNIERLKGEAIDTAALERELNELVSAAYAVPDIAKLRGQRDQSQKRVAEFEAEYRAESRRADALQKEIFEIDRMTECPTCKCNGKGWKQNLLGSRESERSEAIGMLKDLEKRQDEAARELALATENLDAALQLDLKEQERKTKITALEARVRVARSSAAELERAKKLFSDLSHKQFGLASHPTDPDANLDANIEVARKGIAELEEVQRKADMAKAEASRRAQTILEHGDLEIDVKVLTEAVKALEGLQVKMVEEAFNAILEKANRLTDGILPSKLEYRDGEIGRWNGGTWVRHKAFSGTEKALAYAAISVALASNAPVKIVMIDEMGRLDAENKCALVKRAKELVESGTIDQFIGIDTTEAAMSYTTDAEIIAI